MKLLSVTRPLEVWKPVRLRLEPNVLCGFRRGQVRDLVAQAIIFRRLLCRNTRIDPFHPHSLPLS